MNSNYQPNHVISTKSNTTIDQLGYLRYYNEYIMSIVSASPSVGQ